MDGRGDTTHTGQSQEGTAFLEKHLQKQTDGSPASNLRLLMKNSHKLKNPKHQM